MLKVFLAEAWVATRIYDQACRSFFLKTAPTHPMDAKIKQLYLRPAVAQLFSMRIKTKHRVERRCWWQRVMRKQSK